MTRVSRLLQRIRHLLDQRGVTIVYNPLFDAAIVIVALTAALAAPAVRAAWPESRELIALIGAGLGSITALILFARWQHR